MRKITISFRLLAVVTVAAEVLCAKEPYTPLHEKMALAERWLVDTVVTGEVSAVAASEFLVTLCFVRYGFDNNNEAAEKAVGIVTNFVSQTTADEG